MSDVVALMKSSGNLIVQEAPGGYELIFEGERAGFADVLERAGEAVLPHVEVDPKFSGRGFGTFLVRDMLADLKAKGKKVKPICPFVVAYLQKHPEAV